MSPPLRIAPLAALALIACSGSDDTGHAIAQACANLAAARCSQRSNCSRPDGTLGPGVDLLETYGDLPTCLAREALACRNELAAPRTGNSAAKVVACVAAFTTFSCADFFDNVPPAACAPTGSRAEGAPCTFDSQCESGACAGAVEGVWGTCGHPAVLGQDCSATRCAHGERCLAGARVCAAPGLAGDACDRTHPCDRGLACASDSGATTTGTCRPAGTSAGASCSATSAGCDGTRGLACGGPDGARTCRPVGFAGATAAPDGGLTAAGDGGAPGPTPAGTACGLLPDGTRAGCVAGGCYTGAGPATDDDIGTCQPHAADGEACDTRLGPGCLPPARCVPLAGTTAGTCVVPVAAACPDG
jgi:hypothetical protein